MVLDNFRMHATFLILIIVSVFYGRSQFRWVGTLGRNGNEFMVAIGREHCARIGFDRIDFYVILPLKFHCARAHWSMLFTIKDASCRTLIVIVTRIRRVCITKVQFTVFERASRIFRVPSNSVATIVTASY